MIQSFLNKKSEFSQNIGKLFFSNVLYQAFLYGAHFYIIKHYLPKDYGIFTSVVSLSSIVSVLFTLRLDLAYVSKKSNKKARILILGIIFQVAALWGLSTFFAFLYVFSFKEKIEYVLLPTAGVIISFSHVLTAYLVRQKKFFYSGLLLILQSSFFLGGMLTLSYLTHCSSSLYFSRFFGYFSATLVIFLIQKHWKLNIKELSKIKTKFLFRYFSLFKRLLRQNWRYILFNTPYSLIGLFSRDSAILLFAYFGDFQTSGYLALIKTVFNAPIYFISSSLSSVIHKEAAEHLGSPCFSQKIINTSVFIFKLAWIPMLFLFFEGENLFRFFIGEKWSQAGHYASILSPALFLFLFSSWTGRIFDVAKKQKISFLIQVFFDTVTVILIFYLVKFKFHNSVIIYCLMLLNSAYHITYVYSAFKISDVSLKLFFKKIKPSAVLILFLAILVCFTYYFSSSFIEKLALVSILYVCFLNQSLRRKKC
jgi:O-antigen/teichoic acid export membrane protein